MTATTITVPLLGFAPDLDPATPGVLFAVNQMEATRRGWRLARALVQSGISGTLAVGSYMLDGFRSRTTAGTEVVTVAYYDPVATKVKLLVNESGTLTDESRGAFYSLTDNVSFCQYGDYTIATNLTDILQIRDATTTNSFADSAATGIPKAKIAVTAGPHSAQRVVLLDYNDGTAYRDGVWWSGYGGPTAAWTADIGTGAGYNRLLGCGIIQAAHAYGDDIVIWGARSTWLGRFTGPPELMQFYKLSDEIGCVGPAACKVVNGILYWVGTQGIFQFDGQRVLRAPFPIQGIVRKAADVNTQLVRDDTGERLIICTGQRSATLNLQQTAYSVNLINGKVGAVGRKGSAFAYQGMIDGPYYFGWDGASQILRAYSESANANNGTLGTTGFELSPIGSDRDHTTIISVIPRFTAETQGASGDPGSFRLDADYGDTFTEVDDNTITAVTVTASPWRAAVRQAARWIKPQLTFTYNGEEFEVIDVLVEVEGAGKR